VENEEGQDESREAENEEAGHSYVKFENCQLTELSAVLLNILHEILHPQRYRRNHLYQLNYEVPEEAQLITFTNTVSNPRAVVIMGGHTEVAGLTMLGAQWLIHVADVAVFRFYEEDYIIVFIR